MMKRKKVADVTPNKKEAILQSLANGSFVSTACGKAGIDRRTFYRWCISDKKFYKAVEESKRGQIGVAEDSLYKNVLNGNVTAQIFFLCNRAKEKWINVNKVEHTGKDGEPIKLTFEGMNPPKANNIKKIQ